MIVAYLAYTPFVLEWLADYTTGETLTCDCKEERVVRYTLLDTYCMEFSINFGIECSLHDETAAILVFEKILWELNSFLM